mmetsp:Transcript_2312/g.5528  ORF Transcript_2312/g.5528 Transcript_2312/m.5528 type:complete len:246 (-) Transcript_2312:789-1526(-)
MSLAFPSLVAASNLKSGKFAFVTLPSHTKRQKFSAFSSSSFISSSSSSSSSSCAPHLILFITSLWNLARALGPPSTTRSDSSSVTIPVPCRCSCLALMSILYRACFVCLLFRSPTLYRCTVVSSSVSFSSLEIFFSRFSSSVFLRAAFRSSWFFRRSFICRRTSCSIFVGSAVASAASTLIMLLILTFGSGGAISPLATISCRCVSLSILVLLLSFFLSFLVRNMGRGGGSAASAGGSRGMGCST